MFNNLFLALLINLTLVCHTNAITKNGFNLDNASIPTRSILSGGPPRDGIPAINKPKFVDIKNAQFLKNEDRVIGIVINGQARAYPIKILDHHELVNDYIADQYFTVSYCPLCGTGMVFATNLKANGALIFGVSGLLYNSDVLLYDRNTESLWSQIMKTAISGKLKGLKLTQIPALHTTFKEWKTLHPDTEVLSTDTGFKRNYTRSAYRGYDKTKRLWFKVAHKSPKEYHPKEQVLGVDINGIFKAYPFVELIKHEKKEFLDDIGGVKIRVIWNANARSAYIQNEAGKTLNSTVSYWFAWFAFHPDTQIFKSNPALQPTLR